MLGKHMILFGNSSHAIRYDRLLDASRPFPGFAGLKSMTGITFDTGALIGIERRKARITRIFLDALRRGTVITVPVPVLIEWWRGRSDWREQILDNVVVELTTIPLAQRAGVAAARVKGATAIDALVMASASTRGDVVFTSDVDDLEPFRAEFPEVRVLGV